MHKSFMVPEPPSIDLEDINLTQFFKHDKLQTSKSWFTSFEHPSSSGGTTASNSGFKSALPRQLLSGACNDLHISGSQDLFNANIEYNHAVGSSVASNWSSTSLDNYGDGLLAIAETFWTMFKFEFFNAVQSKILDDVLYTDNALVVSAPTGSGKTVIFELAIIRLLLQTTIQPTNAFKVVYMAPIKALCNERYEDWNAKFAPVGLKCMELTGDSLLEDYGDLHDVHIIVTTPEKWDHMTRRSACNKSLFRLTRLFLIDEVHLVSDSQRGATLEAVVSRMKTIHSLLETDAPTTSSTVRFVAVSATIPNIEDIAEWLSSREAQAVQHKFDESCRPVILRKVVLDYPCGEEMTEFRFDMMLSYRLANVIQSYAESKPTLVFCSTRKSTMHTASILVKDMTFFNNFEQKLNMQQIVNGLKDTKLQDLVLCGVGYHHAGMDVNDRRLIETVFSQGILPVLVSTSTLAMGVNLPAHLVVIKSTQHYVMGVHQEYNDTQIQQMTGRAGRPQFDTSATVVIMTKTVTKEKYKAILDGSQLLESSLHQNLIEHLNVEVTLSTITNIRVSLEWLRSTFLYIRANKNPKYYGIPSGLDRNGVERCLQDLCLKDIHALARISLVKIGEDNCSLMPTDTGRLMARFCVAFETMNNLHQLRGDETLEQLLDVICLSHEFREIQLRMSEKRILNTLNKDKSRLTIRFPMNGKIKTPSMKVNCLIQAHFGCLPLQDFALQQEVNTIVRSGIRISRCLMEVMWNREHFSVLLNAVNIVKCFNAHMWENSHYVTKQLSGIGITLANVLVNAGITSLETLLDRNPRDVELILNRQPPFGSHLRDAALHVPAYSIKLHQKAGHNMSVCDLSVTVTLTNSDLIAVKSTADKSHYCILLIGDMDNKLVHRARVSDAVLLRNGEWTRRVRVQRATAGDVLRIHFISQNWVGTDVKQTFQPSYLGGTYAQTTSKFTSSATKKMQSIEKSNYFSTPNRQDGAGTSDSAASKRRPCNHTCLNKKTCFHSCCKIGIKVKRRAVEVLHTDNAFNQYSNDEFDATCSATASSWPKNTVTAENGHRDAISAEFEPVSKDDWSNVDLFRRYNEASSDHSATMSKRQKFTPGADTFDNEFDNIFTDEDFQCFPDEQSTSLDHTKSFGNQFQSLEQTGAGHVLYQRDCGGKIAKAQAEKCSTLSTAASSCNPTCSGASSDVVMAQSIARSRLRDFDVNPDWNLSSIMFNAKSTPPSFSSGSGDHKLQDQQHTTEFTRSNAMKNMETRMNFDLVSDYDFEEYSQIYDDQEQEVLKCPRQTFFMKDSSTAPLTGRKNYGKSSTYNALPTGFTSCFATPQRRETQDLSNVFSGIF